MIRLDRSNGDRRF